MSAARREADERFMSEALRLASHGRGRVAPNPMVGAVVVRDGEIAGRGFHVFDRLEHAEVVALREAGERARGATLYVTLEPCSSHGRTPPCTDAVRAAGIARVVAAHADPDARHAALGLLALRSAGIEVEAGVLREETARLNERWLHRLDTDRAHVTVKLATSLDARIATESGASRWITSEEARASVRDLRRCADAVLVGVGTVLADDPRLTLRTDEDVPGPWRCVVDPRLRTPPAARILAAPPPGERARGTIVVTSSSFTRDARRERQAAALTAAGARIVDVPSWTADGAWLAASEIASALASCGIDGVLVEGGGVTAGTFLSAPDAQRLVLHQAPIVIGDAGRPAVAGFSAASLDDVRRFVRRGVRELGPDLEVVLEPELGWKLETMIEDLIALEQRLEA